MYDDILVPVDGSAPSDAALAHAFDLALQVDATVHILSVVDERALHATQLDAAGLLDAYEKEAQRIVSKGDERADDAGVDAVTAVKFGSPHREILKFADDIDADVIVMGTHGRRGLERYLLGSVTERVLRLSDVPVLTIRAEDSPFETE